MKTLLLFSLILITAQLPYCYSQDQGSIRLNFVTKGIELEKTTITKDRVSLILDNQSHSSHVLKLYKNKRVIKFISLKTLLITYYFINFYFSANNSLLRDRLFVL